MRTFAKLIVVIGAFIAVGGAIGTEVYRYKLNYDARYAFISPAASGRMYEEARALTWTPWLITGAAMAAFGILILAIRPAPGQ